VSIAVRLVLSRFDRLCCREFRGTYGNSLSTKGGREDSFAFKCHRHQDQSIFSVNGIAFNNAKVGSDDVISFWDKDKK
jgi:hypothetical protein